MEQHLVLYQGNRTIIIISIEPLKRKAIVYNVSDLLKISLGCNFHVMNKDKYIVFILFTCMFHHQMRVFVTKKEKDKLFSTRTYIVLVCKKIILA